MRCPDLEHGMGREMAMQRACLERSRVFSARLCSGTQENATDKVSVKPGKKKLCMICF